MKYVIFALFIASMGFKASANEKDIQKFALESREQANAYKDEVTGYLKDNAANASGSEQGSFLWDEKDAFKRADSEHEENYQIATDSSSPLEKGESCSNKVCKGHVREQQEPTQVAGGSQLIIFVSFSMPEESLKVYSRDVKKAGGRLVINGLVDDSFQKTQKKLMGLGVDLEIDPVAFETHSIKKVPTILFINENQEADQMIGHVSLDHALEEFAGKGNKNAQKALENLQGGA